MSYPVLTTVALIILSHFLPGTVNGDNYDDKEGFHSIQRGTRKTAKNKPVDLLLFHDNVKVDGSMLPFPRVISHDLCYPPKGNKHAEFTITAFNVEDEGKRGLAFLKGGGGVGKHKLCLHLKSQRGKGYHFKINVWGYYN